MLFGVAWGTLFTWVGATIGAVLSYLLAKALGRDFVNQLVGGKLAALDRRLERNGFLGVLILRLVPLFPFVWINFGCGLTGIRLRDYTLATAVGILPGTFVYQFLFATVGERLLTEGLKWEYFRDPQLLAALGLFAVFVIVGKWLAGKAQQQPAEPAQSE